MEISEETRRKGNTKFHIPFKIHLFRHLQYHIYVQCPCCVSMAPKNELADSLSCSLSVGTSASLCVTSSLCRFTIYTTRPPVHVSSTSYFKFDGGSSTSTHLTASVHFKGLHSAMRSSCTFAETSVKSSLLCCNNIIKKHICNVFIASILYMSVLGSSFCHLMVKRRDNVEKSTD